MHILFGDETNLEHQNKNIFFIYGGLIVPIEKMPSLNEKINLIRDKFGYKPGDNFKYNHKECPKRISKEKHAKAKKMAIDACIECGCKLIASITHHKIISKNRNNQIYWSADNIIKLFHDYLIKNRSYGICLFDTLPTNDKSPNKFLKDKFQKGLEYEKMILRLDNINAFGITCNNASNISSLTDIAIGYLRYCVNENPEDENSKKIMKQLLKLFLKNESGSIRNIGIKFSPNNPMLYKKEYDELINKLNQLSI